MPSVYSSVFQIFLRQGFSKSFTHGYAQSVVAATHPHVLNSTNRPSFARRNSTRGSRLSSLGFQTAFHTATAQPGHALPPAASVDQKRIEWNPLPASVLLADANHGAAEHGTADVEPPGQDVLNLTIPPEDEAVLAHIDAALEREIGARKQAETASLGEATPSLAVDEPMKAATPISNVRTPASFARTATPRIDSQSQLYADHLTELFAAGRYADIPPVFEAMALAGVQPLTTAYNALLSAAIHTSKKKIEIVSRALDVYADMLRRKVSPDSDTYNILVGLLAGRSLEISAMRKSLEARRLRFGGMDEPGKFMLASHELEHAILCEVDRLDLAVQLFESSVASGKAAYSSESYHQLISACGFCGRLTEMLKIFGHMEANKAAPFAATFPAMITAFANSGDLISAVECYNEYKSLAIANDNGEPTLKDRLDSLVYASVINAYVVSDKMEGAMTFYKKIVQEYGACAVEIKDAIISQGFVKALIHRGILNEAFRWAQSIEDESRASIMSEIATVAADRGDRQTAVAAFASITAAREIPLPATALLAMSIREGDVVLATKFWQTLCAPEVPASSLLIEPTAMYAVAMIGSGLVADGLCQSETMFKRIRQYAIDKRPSLDDEIDEAADFVQQFMAARGIADFRQASPQTRCSSQTLVGSPYSKPTLASNPDDNLDPYAHNTDYKASSLIADELEGRQKCRGPRLDEALALFRSVRQTGRHPRYITYAKLISAAARYGKMDLALEILAMCRSDVPPCTQYAAVRYGWSSILDAMVGACLTSGNRAMAEQFHQEMLAMGTTPSANTFGLYITTLRASTKTFDEASEAIKIFQRARAEEVEPSSFLYNALIGKLGKARRIDDCLFYFAEMRALGIKLTSVTYGTVVNALCRVSDERLAEELFDEMESAPNYKPRPAPYNSMMQFFLSTKRNKTKVLAYLDRMQAQGIDPTAHTYKLLVDTHATLEPIDMAAAEAVLEDIRAAGHNPEPVHYASLIHARGCNLDDMAGAQRIFDSIINDSCVAPNACLFQALFESMVANHQVAEADRVLDIMRLKGVELTAYIANTLIRGWTAVKNIVEAEAIYSTIGAEKREPSTYEAMTRAFLAVEEHRKAAAVVSEMLSRGYPSAVANKVVELLAGGHTKETIPAMVA